MHGIVIAGTHSSCGKTTVTLGLLAALRKRGLRVQPFKTGPDFIDAGLHRMITGRPSRNLDLWMCGEDYVKSCYSRNSSCVDVSVIEGVMGLFDGPLSTASLAATLHLPVVVVIDSYGIAETAGALLQGLYHRAVEKGIELAGVIFNRVASKHHYSRLCADVRDMKILGYLPRQLEFEIPHRHLGLTVAEENPIPQQNLDRLADTVLNYIDVDALIQREAGGGRQEAGNKRPAAPPLSPPATVAVACDKAFCFYYEDNLDLLKEAGAQIVTFSPLSDAAIPGDADAVYIGGGYPELYAKELSENLPLLRSIRTWADSGKPLYAECGGLMYLSKGIHDFEEKFFEMAGVFPFVTRMKRTRSKLGYREVVLKEDCILGKKGGVLRGHAFHYSEIAGAASDTATQEIYTVKNGYGEKLPDEGYRLGKTLASYIHLHFGSNPGIAGAFIKHAQAEGK